MRVGQNGTEWDTKKRFLAPPVASNRPRRCSEHLACHKMSQNVTPGKGVFQALFEGCPKMSANVRARKKIAFAGRLEAKSGVQHFATLCNTKNEVIAQ